MLRYVEFDFMLLIFLIFKLYFIDFIFIGVMGENLRMFEFL